MQSAANYAIILLLAAVIGVGYLYQAERRKAAMAEARAVTAKEEGKADATKQRVKSLTATYNQLVDEYERLRRDCEDCAP